MQKTKMMNPATVKIISIAIMILLLLIPSSFITSLVNERSRRKSDALSEVAQKWGGIQKIAGPVLNLPYKVEYKNKNGEIEESTNYIHLLPEVLDIDGNLKPELRYRGIYEFVFYKSKINFKGKFNLENLDEISINKKNIIWEDAFINFSISSMIGIKEEVKINWDGKIYEFKPGIGNHELFNSGINKNVVLETDKKEYSFEMDLNLNGSEDILFTPLGKRTSLNLKSTWSNPSFSGAFIPYEKEINGDGFNAKWKIFDLNRNYAQVIYGKKDVETQKNQAYYNIDKSQFGLKFLLPVDEYKKNTRSVKYMIMFVGLSFIIFFFVEVVNKRRIHPIQYLLVGFSNIVFYLLLLSISEHLTFNIAYLISSVATILLVSIYSISVLGGKKFALIMSVSLLSLYLLLYVLLQNQDYSLLLGSVGLFIFLALVMYISRNIDWYDISFDQDKNRD